MPKSGLTFRKIEMVEAVAKHHTVSAAALAIGISQPALTQGIKALEAELGVVLFNRTPGGLVPTAFAEPFTRYAAELRAEMAETSRELRKSEPAAKRVLHVQCGPRSYCLWVKPALSHLAETEDPFEVTTLHATHSYFDNLMAQKVDMGLVPIDVLPKSNDLILHPFSVIHNRFVCRADHPLASIQDPTLDMLRNYPLVSDSVFPRFFAMFGGDVGALSKIMDDGSVGPAIHETTLEGIIETLQNSNAIGILPPTLVESHFRPSELVMLGDLYCRLPALPIALAYHKNSANKPDIHRFIKHLERVEIEQSNFLI